MHVGNTECGGKQGATDQWRGHLITQTRDRRQRGKSRRRHLGQIPLVRSNSLHVTRDEDKKAVERFY